MTKMSRFTKLLVAMFVATGLVLSAGWVSNVRGTGYSFDPS